MTTPICDLLADPEISEILINGPTDILYERQGVLHRHKYNFLSADAYEMFLRELYLEAQMQPNLDIPYADGQWRGFRLHCIVPPLVRQGAHVSLRRHPETAWTFTQLAKQNWAPESAIQIIKNSVAERKNILIVGGTGSGKTSVLNACLNELKSHERALILEDTPELTRPNPLCTQLVTRFDFNQVLRPVNLTELLRQSLRMRPDRIVVGEVRGGEAKDLLMALSCGHRGGLCTLHADHPRQALYRLEMLVLMGAAQWSLHAIRHLILYGLDLVICVERKNGFRRLKNISRVASLEDTGFCLEPLYEVEPQT